MKTDDKKGVLINFAAQKQNCIKNAQTYRRTDFIQANSQTVQPRNKGIRHAERR